MRVLYLLRHAKSSWDDPALSDSERPLSRRGVRDAKRIAEHLRVLGVRPANDSAPGRLVFNRTIGLRDSWARLATAQAPAGAGGR